MTKPKVNMNYDVNTTEIDKLFVNVVDKLLLAMPSFFEPDDETAKIKRKIIRRGFRIPNRIDYNEHWLAFNKAFFLKNLYKNLIAISYLMTEGIALKEPIIDIGSGAGPSSLAFTLLNSSNSSKATLVDQTKRQLELANKLMDIMGFKGWTFINKAINGNRFPLEGTVILSYFLCEQTPSNFDRMAQKLLRTIKDSLIVLDYVQNISKFENNLLIQPCKYKKWNLHVPLSTNTAQILGSDYIHVNACLVQPILNYQ